jgi:hypothetical protein
MLPRQRFTPLVGVGGHGNSVLLVHAFQIITIGTGMGLKSIHASLSI